MDQGEKATTSCDARPDPRAPPTQQQHVLDHMLHPQEPLGEHPRTCSVIQAPTKDSIEVHDGAGRPRWQLTTSTTSSLQLRPRIVLPNGSISISSWFQRREPLSSAFIPLYFHKSHLPVIWPTLWASYTSSQFKSASVTFASKHPRPTCILEEANWR